MVLAYQLSGSVERGLGSGSKSLKSKLASGSFKIKKILRKITTGDKTSKRHILYRFYTKFLPIRRPDFGKCIVSAQLSGCFLSKRIYP